ncbi:hypothetical protein ACKAV7_008484 [Fusarium commune]
MDNPAAMPVTTIIQSFAPVLHRPRRNYPRCRSGCLTCRQRKKKCDEGKPNCSNCLRNHVRCRWPGPASRDDDGDSRTPTEPLQQLEPKRGGMERDAVATWNNRGVPLLSRERACSLTSVSSTLFEHYLTQTAALLVPLPMSHNPFIRLILPVAFSDDLVMHSILALSGSHLGHQQVNSVEIQHATWRHYLVVIRSLRSEIQDHGAVSDNPDKTLRLLMAGKGGAGRLVLDEIQGHVEAVLDLAPLLEESCFDYTILWPIIICGSCLVEESLKRRVLSGLSSSRYHMGHTKTACQLLDALWADPDPRAYGPYGLHLVMEKHGFSFCSL